jgi:FAD/FMN-containing dehydrogenase
LAIGSFANAIRGRTGRIEERTEIVLPAGGLQLACGRDHPARAAQGQRRADVIRPAPNSDGTSFACHDPGYEAARRGSCWNARLPERYPEIIVQAKDERDVVAAIQLANAKGWKVGVRAGGHSWAGNHLRDGGMLLDVSRLDSVAIDPEKMRARAGPGCTGDSLDRLLAGRRLFFPIGHCRGIGLGGYALQGGFGWNSRAVGLACENVIGIDYVGADGVLRHASASENEKMLWAARGAGPGFFGVVTQFHLKLHPRPPMMGIKLAFYPIGRLEALLRWAERVAADVPRSIELMLAVSRTIPFIHGAGIAVIAPVFADSFAAARRDLRFMKSRPAGARVATPLLPMRLSWMAAAVMGHYPDGHNYAVDNMWTGGPIDDLLPDLRGIAGTLPTPLSHMLLVNWSPAGPRADMAYSLDDRFYIALYGVWKEAKDDEAASSWATDGMRRMARFATGLQLADENLGMRPGKFLADANMARLDALRARYDRDGRFHSYMGRALGGVSPSCGDGEDR